MDFFKKLFQAPADKTKKSSVNDGENKWSSHVHGVSITTRVFQNDIGMQSIEITNGKSKESIEFPRHCLDATLKALAQVKDKARKAAKAETPEADTIQQEVFFNGKRALTIEVHPGIEQRAVIRAEHPSRTGNKILNIPVKSLTVLEEHFGKVYKSNHLILNSIVDYHHLFQFTFEGESESIKSDLAVRKNALWEIVPYQYQASRAPTKIGQGGIPNLEKPSQKSGGKVKKSLGDRDKTRIQKFDLDRILNRNATPNASDSGGKDPAKRKTNRSYIELPVLASAIKNLQQIPIEAEFSSDEIQEIREMLTHKKKLQYCLGFEIVDAIFKENSALKSFRFPLYFLFMDIEESGNKIFLKPKHDNRLHINHIGLAALASKLGKVSKSMDPVEYLFRSMQSQKIQVNDQLEDFRMMRSLPVSSDLFTQNREILFGPDSEKNIGGILSFLELRGLDIDTDSAFLYPLATSQSILHRSLADDLEHIQSVAKNTRSRFDSSLLGKFLSVEEPAKKPVNEKDNDNQPPANLAPGVETSSSERLRGLLYNHNIVLLEGPPGTGKTFSIRNLLIDAICNEKRVLITSDKEGAIDALLEKMEEYACKDDSLSYQGKKNIRLWKAAIKAVRSVPNSTSSLEKWALDLKKELNLNETGGFDREPDGETAYNKLNQLIESIKTQIRRIQKALDYFNPEDNTSISPQFRHATTDADIAGLVTFVEELHSKDQADAHRLWMFLKNREYLKAGRLDDCMDFVHPFSWEQNFPQLKTAQTFLFDMLRVKPTFKESFTRKKIKEGSDPISKHIAHIWNKKYNSERSSVRRLWDRVSGYFYYPLTAEIQDHIAILQNSIELHKLVKSSSGLLERSLEEIHDHISNPTDSVPLGMQLLKTLFEKRFMKGEDPIHRQHAIHSNLKGIETLEQKRDDLIHQVFQAKLKKIARDANAVTGAGGTSPSTSISTLLQNISKIGDYEKALPSIKELQKLLSDTFPVWICRKQVVPFVLPCTEKSFDLVVVDEATQCRVDDGLPLIFRAKKFLVVGDDKQTVLAKNSPVDDYLFNEFSLEELLRSSQARGVKGGGSHIFGLVKGIREASVMLDEHYRCPPDIIAFSNKYVYDGELKNMQWKSRSAGPSLVIDHSEGRLKTGPKRQESGQFKGIETDMVDRFMDFVYKQILAIEKERGTRVHLDTEVAICYFLLKNEPYIKRIKPDLIRKLRGRGENILDGAGAALQGKERNYIFYLWDMSKSNMMAFSQGDDETKRKGELNVLMSRPKLKSYHYLHHGFAKLNHARSSIATFLWDAHLEGRENREKGFQPRLQRPDPSFHPWGRGSGQLIQKVLLRTLPDRYSIGSTQQSVYNFDYSVSVGDPKYKIDLMLTPNPSIGKNNPAVGIVDLAQFSMHGSSADEIKNFYFQIKRATPKIIPIFAYVHEIADSDSIVSNRLKAILDRYAKPVQLSASA